MGVKASLWPRKMAKMKKKDTFVSQIACYSQNSL